MSHTISRAPESGPIPHAPSRDPELAASRVVGLLLLAGIVLVYWPCLGADFIGYDDPMYVSRNPDVLRGFSWAEVRWAFTSFRESNWHPLTWLSLMLDRTFFELQAPGYRFTNLLLHWANAMLLLTVLRKAAGRFWPAALVAGLFALHPQHVESVAWISERKDVLCAFFWLLSMLAYLKYAREERRAWLWGAVLLMALGSMAKQMIVTLPFALLLVDFWPLRRFGPAGIGPGEGGGRAGWREFLPPLRLLVEKIPFLAVAAGSSCLTVLAQDPSISSLDKLPMHFRVANALTALVRYLDQTFAPRDLAVFYPHPGATQDPWAVACSAAFLLALTALVFLLLRRQPWLAFGWLWFAGTLVPVIGLVQVGAQSMADRYMYIPHMGLFVGLVWGADYAVRRLRLARWFAWGAALLVLGGLGALTWRQTGFWKDTGTLFTRTADVTERNYMAHLMAANLAMVKGDMREYCRHYDLAVAYNRGETAYAHVKFGYSRAVIGDVRTAVFQFIQALQVQPDHPVALYNLATVYRALKRYSEAEELLERVKRSGWKEGMVADALDSMRQEQAQARRILGAGRTWWNATAWNSTTAHGEE